MANVYFTTADGEPGTLLQACDLLNEANRLADAVFMACEAMSDYEAGAVQAVMLPLKSKMEDCHTIIDRIRGDKWSPDSELLKAEQEFIEADADWRALVHADDHDQNEKGIFEALDKCKEIADRLFALPANTMEGVAAKARVGELSGWDTCHPDPDHVLAITADLKRLAAAEGSRS